MHLAIKLIKKKGKITFNLYFSNEIFFLRILNDKSDPKIKILIVKYIFKLKKKMINY